MPSLIRERPRHVVRLLVVALGAALISACSHQAREPAPVTDREARAALHHLAALAAVRTPQAMRTLCHLSLDQCHGLSGSVMNAPDGYHTAPRTAASPHIVCSRDAGRGAWMLVVDGKDGQSRPYVSQLVFGRNTAGRVVPLREPAYWYGIVYYGTKVTGSTGWTAMNSPGIDPAGKRERALVARAHQACMAAR